MRAASRPANHNLLSGSKRIFKREMDIRKSRPVHSDKLFYSFPALNWSCETCRRIPNILRVENFVYDRKPALVIDLVKEAVCNNLVLILQMTFCHLSLPV